MFLDLIFVIIIVFAIIKGYRQGLIVGIFSLIAVVIGLAAAMKLSTVMAGYIGKSVNISEKWLPVISFALVFIMVLILIRLGAKAVERTAQFVMLGWLNRLGGVLFYAAIYIIIFSVLLFYAGQMGFIKDEVIQQSATYSFVQPWGPKAINGFGDIIPAFKNMFADLETFFSTISEKISLL